MSTLPSNLQHEIERELKRAGDSATTHPDRLRTGGISDSEVQIPQAATESEEAYRRFLASLSTEVVPQWLWQIRSSAKTLIGSDGSELIELRFEFANATRMPAQSRNVEPFLFDPTAVFRVSNGGHFVPYELDQIPRGFQYDRALWGRGFNCATEKGIDAIGDFVCTNNTPMFRQPRYSTRTVPDCPFDVLASDPFPVLEEVLRGMKAYMVEWEECRSEYSRDVPGWDTKFAELFDSDLQRFVSWTERFEEGLSLLRGDSDALMAFKLTNEVFSRGPNRSWRLFQLVFSGHST